MPVNLPPLGELLPVPGIVLGTAEAAIKHAGRDDIAVLVGAPGSTVGAVFTRNAFRAPPVLIAEARVQDRARASEEPCTDGVALLINSGNANAATGEAGAEDARALCARVADRTGLAREAVLPFSTGVIGERLPVPAMLAAIDRAVAAAEANRWAAAATAIMTTDTAPKGVSRQLTIGGQTVTLTGMVKGAGMIKPAMATMLAFIGCDARVSAPVLQELTQRAADRSLNRVTVDGDTSTNDAFVVVATGQADNALIDGRDPVPLAALESALTELARELAQRLVRDAEGATRFVTVRVVGGASEADCLAVAYTVAESPLVKTALFAGDPNWGRFCMAIGRAPVTSLNVERINVDLDGVPIARAGRIAPTYDEAQAAAVMTRDEYEIRIELGDGAFEEVVWTSDLSYDYVRINAEYRT